MIMDLGTFTLNPVTLALLILGIVEFIKKFGLSGNKLLLVSMVIGIFFAVVYRVSELIPAAEIYIQVAFFGIAAGLCASGIYSFVNARFPPQTKATLKYTKITRGTAADKEEYIQ
jgi:membrane protein implicated in regulation of membrane protease activity